MCWNEVFVALNAVEDNDNRTPQQRCNHVFIHFVLFNLISLFKTIDHDFTNNDNVMRVERMYLTSYSDTSSNLVYDTYQASG